MNITEVRVFPVDEEKLKAFASIVIDDAFVVSDIKIIEGRKGRFLSMPSTKRKNGTFRDIAHPLNNETRHLIEQRVFARYEEILASDGRIVSDDEFVPQQAAMGALAPSPLAPPRRAHAGPHAGF